MSDIVYKDSPIISIDVLINDEVKKFSIAAIESLKYSYVCNSVTQTPKLVFLSEDKNIILNENPYTGGITGLGVSDWNLKESLENKEPFKIITDDPIEAIKIYKKFVIIENEAIKNDDIRYKKIESALKSEFVKTISISGLTIEFNFTKYIFYGIVCLENENNIIMRLVDDLTTKGRGFSKTGRIQNSVISKVSETLNIDKKEAKNRINEVIKIYMDTYREFSHKRS